MNKILQKTIEERKILRNCYPISWDSIPYGRQCIDDDDIAAVVEVLKSRAITQGPKIQEFESALCQLTEAPFTIAVNSGTAALHIACLAAGIGPGDEVITSPNTFVASANCIAYCGAKPIFADIDSKTHNISPAEIEKHVNERTKAVIPVDFAGQSSDMEAIQKLVHSCEKRYGHKIYIIEDACHALGSSYKKTKAGSCVYSDMAVLSFHPVKHITTGEGGAVLTNHKELQQKLSCLRTHGITSNPEEFSCRANGFEKDMGAEEPIRRRWYYEQNYLGYNYRMTDLQAALGISQLKKMVKFSQRRREIVDRYNAAFKGVEGLTTPFEQGFCHSNFHLYVLQFDFEKIGMSRAQVMAALARKRIQTQVHYIPVHTQPYYQKQFGYKWGDYPMAEEYYKTCLSIPLFPMMKNEDVKRVVTAIMDVLHGR